MDSQEVKGGYDCEFIESPPEVLQTECSVCFLVLREPTIVSCCGYSFCRTCIEEVQAGEKPCPLCNTSEFTTLLEKKLQRLLKERKVWCAKKDGGCDWVGELGKLDEHLNAAPTPEHRLEGCPYMAISCSFCQEAVPRQAIQKHEDDQCPQRPYSCDYCRDYAASFDDVVNKHYPVCKCYPLSCPNKCDELDGTKYMIERHCLEHHIREECPLAVVECDFHYAGCGVKLPRKELADHLAKDLVAHMSLLAIHGKKLAADSQKAAADALEERDRQLAQLREDMKQLLKSRDEEVDQMQERIDELERENRSLIDIVGLHSHLSTPPVMFTMNNFAKCTLTRDTWYSPSFYTHPHGYKLCIMVACESRACRINAILMRGEFDNCLHWPFQKDVYIQILNQVTDDNHITITGAFSSGPATDNVGIRVVVGEKQLKGRGDIVSYPLLNTDYVKHNCIQLQVTRVIDTVQIDRQILSTISHSEVCMLPCQFTLRNFDQLKRSGERWYSPSFYTHSGGYRMCISVDTNGFNMCKGTSISLYNNLMCGKFDSLLNWPFRGTVVIQLLNQLKDEHHRQFKCRYTPSTPTSTADRVMVGERARGWGPYDFISHDQLGLNLAEDCQYLKNNCLVFRISIHL